jgi:hypothetical protein
METNFFTDVKSPILAGMQFCYTKGETKNNKIKQVGYDVVRIYYDSAEKDCAVSEKRLKRVLNN